MFFVLMMDSTQCPRWTIVYELYHMEQKAHLRLKTSVSEEKSELPTISTVWRTADWHEREIYDMMGVRFRGHPDLRAWSSLTIPGIVGVVAALWLRARSRASWRLVGAGVFKFADVLVWTVRYWACFAIIGVELSPTQAAGIAAVTQIVLLIPLAGNGLGLREWAVRPCSLRRRAICSKI